MQVQLLHDTATSSTGYILVYAPIADDNMYDYILWCN